MFKLVKYFLCSLLVFLSASSLQGANEIYELKVYRIDTLDRVFPDAEPKPLEYIEPLAVPRGGKVAFQFAIKAEQAGKFKINVHAIRGPNGATLKGRTKLYKILPVHVEANSQGCSSTYPLPAQPPDEWKPYLVREAPFDICEVLVEAKQIKVTHGRWQAILVDVEIDFKTAPGKYTGLLHIKNKQKVLGEVPFTFKVHSTVVSNFRLDSTHWFWPEPKNLTTGPLPNWWSNKHWELIENSGKTLREFGDNVILTPLMGCGTDHTARYPLIQTYITSQGTYEFEYSKFEKWCGLFLSLGFKTIEGAHVSDGHNISAIYVYAIDRRTNKKTLLFNPDSDVDKWLDFLKVFFKDFKKVLEKHNWDDLYMQHLMDEPHEVQEYQKLAEVFRSTMGGINSFDAIQNRAFSPYCDIMVFNLGTIVASQDLVAKRRAQGKSVWHYQCCSPYPPYPNCWMDRHLFNSRLYPWLGYLLNSDGYLFWAANLYRGADPYKTSIGPYPGGSQNPGHPVGDAWTYFPGPNGLRGSMRMLAYRDGLIDHTLLCMLSEKDKKTADDIMKSIARATDDYEMTKSPYHNARTKMLDALE